MATTVIMPKVGISVETCTITEWHKKVGDAVTQGEPLFTYETDKSVMEEESPVSGVLLARFYEAGDDVPVLKRVCILGTAGESWREHCPAEAEAPSPPPASPADSPTPKPLPAPEERLPITPRARRLAKRAGINPRFATPSGAGGRVISKDIQAQISRGPAGTFAAAEHFVGQRGSGLGGRFTVAEQSPSMLSAGPDREGRSGYTDEPLSKTRRTIAASMTLSMTTIPQLTHHITFDATQLIACRGQLKEAGSLLGLPHISYNDMILFAVSRVLTRPEHRALNAHLTEGSLRCFDAVHLGLAVDTPRGLMVPTICSADRKSLAEIADEAAVLAEVCRQGKASPGQLSGATFTVSNLGALGIESFTPIINPPQTGILGVNALQTRVREAGGVLGAYPAIGLSLTYDHRAVDGAPASRFLSDLSAFLEHFPAALCC